MQQHSDLLNQLIDFLAKNIPNSTELKNKINIIKNSALLKKMILHFLCMIIKKTKIHVHRIQIISPCITELTII